MKKVKKIFGAKCMYCAKSPVCARPFGIPDTHTVQYHGETTATVVFERGKCGFVLSPSCVMCNASITDHVVGLDTDVIESMLVILRLAHQIKQFAKENIR